MNKSQFKIVDIFQIPGRKEKLFAVEVLEGTAIHTSGKLHSPDTPGLWHVREMLIGDPKSTNVALALSGPEGLTTGMLLVESEATEPPLSQNSAADKATHLSENSDDNASTSPID